VFLSIVGYVTRLDEAAVIRLSGSRRGGWISLMRAATRAGDGELWAVLGLGFGALTEHGGILVQRLALAFAMEFMAYGILKRAFSRPRPFVKLQGVTGLVVPPDEFSFPSGHTAGAFVMLTVAGAAIAPLILPLAALAILIGTSRICLGMHYPSDIAAGALLGAFAGIVSNILI
jgi:undecaprenyl-diphosphatase